MDLASVFDTGGLRIELHTDGRVLKSILLSLSAKKIKVSNIHSEVHPILLNTTHQIIEYFNGERTQFNLPLPKFENSFSSSIHKTIAAIPFGKTLSYKELSEKAGYPGAFRAAGNACGANPLPIVIPCHRVLKSGGFIGGFSAGLEVKKLLLQHEHIAYKTD